MDAAQTSIKVHAYRFPHAHHGFSSGMVPLGALNGVVVQRHWQLLPTELHSDEQSQWVDSFLVVPALAGLDHHFIRSCPLRLAVDVVSDSFMVVQVPFRLHISNAD